MTTFSPAIDTNSFQTNDLLEKDVRRSVGGAGGKAVEGLDEIGEAAAEATARDLIGGDAAGFDEVRVHQVVALIVKDRGDAHALALEDGGGGEDERGLPCPEESANHRDHGLHRGFRGLHLATHRKNAPTKGGMAA